jgi:predicted CopG family antitoxin
METMQERQSLRKDITDTSSTKNMYQKNIVVSQQTYLRLVQLGKMRESFDKLLSRLIDEIGDRRDVENQAQVGPLQLDSPPDIVDETLQEQNLKIVY